ncbi:MAG: NAD(P)-dependent oxidoreductase [Parvibaculaceae bacterium]
MQKLGFIGLGIMGFRMGKNLLRAGHPLVAYDVDPQMARRMEQEGATIAGSPREVAEKVDVLLLSLPDSPQVIEVATGKDGVGSGAHQGLIVIDLSTVAPSTPQRLSKELEPHGVTWLDAPVSGGPNGAEAATLTIMIGGDRPAFESCRAIFDVIGRNIEYMGDSGMGCTAKIVNNFAAGINIIAVSEAFTLGVAAGIDARRLFEVMRTSSSGSWVMENLIPGVVLSNRLSEEPAPRFALRLMHKDLRLAVAAASALKVPLAAGTLAEQMFAIAEGQGWGNRDHMSVIKLYSDYVGIDKW